MALLKDERQPDVAGTDVPEEDTEGIHVHTVVVVTCEKLWGHVYRGAHYTAWHHGFRLAEAQVCQFSSVLLVQQDIFELDVPVHEALGVQEANPLSNIKWDL